MFRRKFYHLFTLKSCAVWIIAAVAIFALGGCKAGPQDFLKRGRKLVEKKDYSRALIEFRNAARLEPKSAEPYYQAGLAFLGMGDYTQGYASILRATQLDPKHAKAQEKLAEMIGSSINPTWDSKNLEEAQKRIESALAVAPGSPGALSALGLSEYLLGNSEDAEKHLKSVLEKFPGNLQAASSLATIKVNQKDLPGAEQILRKAAADSPKSPEAQLALGRFFVLTRRESEADAAYRHALSINPKYSPALVDLFNLQRASGKKDEAEKTLVALSASDDKRFRSSHALYLLDQGRQDEGLRELERISAADPKDPEAFKRLTAAYFQARKFPEAERAIDAALKRNSKDNNALIERSRLYIITAKLQEAETELNKVLHAEPNSATAHYLLSKVFAARGQQLQAQQQLSRALELQPDMLVARLELAQSLIAEGGTPAALDYLNKAPATQRNLLAIAVEKNWALLRAGNTAELRKSIDTALNSYPQAPELILQDGLLKSQLKDIPGARKSLEQVLAARPEDAVALNSLAQTFAAQNQPDVALRTVQQYASQRPNSAALQNLLGFWMGNTGHADEAKKALTAALAADPSFISARMNLALLEARDGNYDAARQNLALVTQAPGMRTQAEVALGEIEQKVGNATAAIPHYRKAIEAAPNDATALNGLAYVLANTDQSDEALKYAQQAKELDPGSVFIEDTLGWAFYRKGLYSSALPHLQNAVDHGNDAVFRYHLAMAYLRSGDRQRGEKVLAEARRLNPGLPEAAEASKLLASDK